jgi:thiamine biosynthesis lipoprotein
MPSSLSLLAGTALAALAPVAADAAPQAEARTWNFHADHVLGTSFDMAVVTPQEAEAQFAFAAAQAEIARLDKVLSGWRDDSELAAFNADPGRATSPDLSAVIQACETWRVRSGGAFDASLNTCPKRLDVDGIAKGYVIDQALSAARRAAPCATAMLVDIGGDLACWGDRAWAVGIADPAAPQDNAAPLAVLTLRDRALAVSGPGPRDRLADGRPVSHLIDAATGQPSPRRQAAVVARTAMDADALATALATLPPARGLALAERISGAEAMVLDIDGTRHETAGWASCQAAAPLPSGFQVQVEYALPKVEAANYRKPYVIVWVTDADKNPIKTLLILGTKRDYQEDNYVWWRRYGRKTPGLLDSVGRPTRAPGKYAVGWDGTDDAGKPVAQGAYLIHIEASREHGGHTYESIPILLGAKPVAAALPPADELGAVKVSYSKRK